MTNHLLVLNLMGIYNVKVDAISKPRALCIIKSLLNQTRAVNTSNSSYSSIGKFTVTLSGWDVLYIAGILSLARYTYVKLDRIMAGAGVGEPGWLRAL
jgi:hypothetical protein